MGLFPVRSKMVYAKFVEIGRVAYIAFGPDAGKLAVIVDVIDQNRALIDGPASGVARRQCSFKFLHLTEYVIKIGNSARKGSVLKAWTKADIPTKWENSTWCKKIQNREKRILLSDFDRFKMLKEAAKKASPKATRVNKKQHIKA